MTAHTDSLRVHGRAMTSARRTDVHPCTWWIKWETAHDVVESVAGQDEQVVHRLPGEGVHDVLQVHPDRVRRAAVPGECRSDR